MTQQTWKRRIVTLGWPALGLALTTLCSSVQAAPPAAGAQATPTAEALLYSTMPSTRAHRPEMAMDGDAGTWFKSDYDMDDGDDFLVRLSRPIPIRSLRITTGDADGKNLLTNGFVEVSADETHYRRAAAFDSAGIASATLQGAPVEALRIRLNAGQDLPTLVVREIAIDSPVRIAHVQLGPGRGFPDLSKAPSVTPALVAWSKQAEMQMEEFWPATEALLYSDDFVPPNMVNVIYRTGPGVTGIAATGGGVMEVNTAWCYQHPEDTPLTVHETAHVIQAYSGYDPVWLVEGIADYIRWVKFEPEQFHPRIDVQHATYHDAYQTTATFLAWCELHYDSTLVTKLSRAVRFGKYNNDLFKAYCGKDVDTLWSEFVAAYRADPSTIIMPPGAVADKPRALPAVTTGSSMAVNLSTFFDTTGLYNDGTSNAAAPGVDGEGNGYSAQLLGAAKAASGVTFQLGPANAPDLISGHGQVIPLPPGQDASLWLLGTAVEGSQMAQNFTITYTDGTIQTLSQSLSDWYQPQDYPGESRMAQMAYRDLASGRQIPRPFYVYTYGFSLDKTKTVKSLTLPQNAVVKILAVALAN